jgi:hypothetical protein
MVLFEDEVSGVQVLTHEMPETAPWKSESAIVARKRVTTVERRAGR